MKSMRKRMSIPIRVCGILKIMLAVLAVLTVLLPCLVGANEISLSLEAERTEISKEEELSVQVVVEGAQDLDSTPVIQNTRDVVIQEGGTSSQISIIGGVTSAKKIFSYSVFPKKSGTITIGPAKLEIHGKSFVSNALTLQVSASASAGAAGAAGGSAAAQQQSDDGGEEGGGTAAAVTPQSQYYVDASVDNPRPYVGEQIIYTFRFYRRVQTANGQLSFPEFKGLWKESLATSNNSRDQQRDYETTINGQRWLVTEIKFALFPMSEGSLVIDPTALLADVYVQERRQLGRGGGPGGSLFGRFFDDEDLGGFFGRMGGGLARLKRVRLQTKAINLQVRALPDNGKPAGSGIKFSGIVGNAKISSEMSKTELRVGESTTLTIRVTTNGRLSELATTELNNLAQGQGSNFKIYDDKPTVESRPTAKGLVVTKIIKKAIVPLREGSLEIPPIKFYYFDPKSETYQVLETKKFTLQVAAGNEQSKYVSGAGQHAEAGGTASTGAASAAGSSMGTAAGTAGSGGGIGEQSSLKREVKLLAQDLMPIIHNQEILKNDKLRPLELAFLLIVILLSPLGYFGPLWLRRRQELYSGDEKYRRKERAFKEFKSNFQKLSITNNTAISPLAATCAKLLREYLSDKLGFGGPGFTPNEVVELLSNRSSSISAQLISEVRVFLDYCDTVQYGGGGINFTLQQKKQLKERLSNIVRQFEKD
ncbi:MAG: protein BatD [Oligoflexia bacterium]|nr:protein BatD [Oligoflexia bacterium]